MLDDFLEFEIPIGQDESALGGITYALRPVACEVNPVASSHLSQDPLYRTITVSENNVLDGIGECTTTDEVDFCMGLD